LYGANQVLANLLRGCDPQLLQTAFRIIRRHPVQTQSNSFFSGARFMSVLQLPRAEFRALAGEISGIAARHPEADRDSDASARRVSVCQERLCDSLHLIPHA
jgi:hypothetical protein